MVQPIWHFATMQDWPAWAIALRNLSLILACALAAWRACRAAR